mgnify:CR=1 FL=1
MRATKQANRQIETNRGGRIIEKAGKAGKRGTRSRPKQGNMRIDLT